MFSHETINHYLNFINLEIDVHKQKIESLWNKLKNRPKVKMRSKILNIRDYYSE